MDAEGLLPLYLFSQRPRSRVREEGEEMGREEEVNEEEVALLERTWGWRNVTPWSGVHFCLVIQFRGRWSACFFFFFSPVAFSLR